VKLGAVSEADPDQVPDVVVDVTVMLVVGTLVDGLGLLKADAGISQQLIAFHHVSGHRSDLSFA
jgi:hypothetical protein